MDETAQHKGSRKRRRLALACESCRRSKIRCDRQSPCGACVRSRHKTCVFEKSQSAASRRSAIAYATAESDTEHRNDLGPVTPASSAPTPRSQDASSLRDPGIVDSDAPVLDVGGVLNRLFEVERRVDGSIAAQEPQEKNVRPPVRNEDETIENYLSAVTHPVIRGVVSKTRYFGQSHWMNGIIHFGTMVQVFENQSKEVRAEASAILSRCKALARTIKAQRSPGIITKFGTNIPPKEVADKLVDAYLRTIETVFRVLHVPSFKRDYEQFWTSPSTAGMSFIILLQLVMAIGCTIFDESFSMRKSAVQWVTEAQYWLLGPPAKGKLTIVGLQIMILIALGRETASVGGDLAWIHVGSLLRSALYMGLHRDPSRLPKMSRLDAEMRRRLWNTIQEIELKTCIDAGGFPAITPDSSDTKAPADVDDIDLMEDETQTNTKPDIRFTDMSVPLALRDSFRERLAVYQMINGTPFRGTYNDTIQLHRRLVTTFKSLTIKLKSYSSLERQPTPFQRRLVELMTRRCFISLHVPYLGLGLQDPAFAFSRRQATESAVKMYSLVFPAILRSTFAWDPSQEGTEIPTTDGDDLARFAICAAGFWRQFASQPSFIISLEVQANTLEDESLGTPTPRPDMLNIIRHSPLYHHARIKAGETNVKGYLFAMALVGHVQALMEGRAGESALEPVLKAALITEKACLDLLKQHGNAGTGDDQSDWDSLVAEDGGWEDDNSGMGPYFDFSSVESFLEPNSSFDFMSMPLPF